MKTIYRQDTDGHPGNLTQGRWDAYRQADFPTTKQRDTAAVSCPKCSRLFCVVGHAINDRGICRPSVVCPHPGCGFHEFVRLDGWTGGVQGQHLDGG